MSATRTAGKSATNAVLWQRSRPQSRDRSRVLEPEDVAAVAIGVAEAESLQAVSVKRVAGRLGIPPLRLQSYVASRGELLELMVDVAIGEVEYEVAEGGDWQVRLWQFAHATKAVVARHPWLSGLLGMRALTGPNGLRFTENSLQTMNGLGLDVTSIARCVESVLVYVCGSVRPTSDLDSGPSHSPDAIAGYLAEVSAQEFPLISELLARPPALVVEDAFDAGLTYLLTGIAAAIADHSGRRS